MTKIIPYAHHAIDEADIAAASDALRQEKITRGKSVEAFEKAVAAYVDAPYAVSFASGSAALYAAAAASGASRADRVFTTPNTFVATAASFASRGCNIQFVDIDANGNISLPALVEKNIGAFSRGKNILVPVHFAGACVDMKALSESLNSVNTVIIEDAAHALGSFYASGEKVGSCAYSDMTIFSFHASKNITCGEGGMVTTCDRELYEKLRCLRDSGICRDKDQWWQYSCEQLICNSHLSEMQAALGLSQLAKIEELATKKKQHVAMYRKLLSGFPGVVLPDPSFDERSHYHLFVVKIDFHLLGLSRTVVMEKLKNSGIMTQYHYIPVYKHKAFLAISHCIDEDFPGMNNHYNKALSLPFFATMTQEDGERVASSLWNVLYQNEA